jgi:hypothetical protein
MMAIQRRRKKIAGAIIFVLVGQVWEEREGMGGSESEGTTIVIRCERGRERERENMGSNENSLPLL